MELQTRLSLKKAKYPLNYKSRLFLMGSCFAEQMGFKFQHYRFPSLSNPFGIVFHPRALEGQLQRIEAQRVFVEDDLFYSNERWNSFEVHSELSDPSGALMLSRLNHTLLQAKDAIRTCTHVIFTLGTSWVYRNRETGKLVASCHKLPQAAFSKEILTIEDIVQSLIHCLEHIRSLNREAHVIMTLSPVRHLKDGFVENQRSKAHLIAALHHLIETGNISYFPAYEIMMDELRDYRFYGPDMVHPNALATDYIWEKFRDSWIDPGVYADMEVADTIQKGLNHKPFHPDSGQYRTFMEDIGSKIVYLKQKYPFMTFDKETESYKGPS